jgi:redox-sensitive bicupin YhaK (pirin superfamily)
MERYFQIRPDSLLAENKKMKKIIHREADRGKADYGWLKTAYSFSFANWYEPTRMGFGVLRVINDDRVAPRTGFDTHSHRDMEIVTIVTSGTVTHKDSLRNTGTVKAGEVQVMSAGTGVAHSEYNLSENEPLSLFQIWIESKTMGIAPRYDQKSFNLEKLKKGMTLVVSPDGKDGSLKINQDAHISFGVVGKDEPLSYELFREKSGVYVFVIEGDIEIAEEKLHMRDAIGITDAERISIKGDESSKILVIEVPLS